MQLIALQTIKLMKRRKGVQCLQEGMAYMQVTDAIGAQKYPFMS